MPAQTPNRAAWKASTLGCATIFLAHLALAQIPKPTDAPRPLTPEESAAAFRVPAGFKVEVVASEPLIASPSAVCWDERGRMFVSELHGYNLAGQLDIEELNKTGKLDTQVRRVQAEEKFKRAARAGTFGVVKLLRDTNGDGRMDEAVVWATNLPPIYGLVPARGGLIVACAPDIVWLADRDGDGKAETREILFTGFPTGELERGINAPQWGVDGWIYFGRGWGGGKITGLHLREPVSLPGSDFRIRADGSAIEPVTGATHTFGFAMTEAGERFTVTTTVPGIFIAPLPWRYLARNPDAATPSLELPTGDRRAYSISKPHPWRQKRADDPAYFKYYNSRYGAAESEADGWFTAACGPMIYQDRALPGLRGQYLVCEPAGNLIHRARIVEDGAALILQRLPEEEKSEFAASTDAWSHPMNLTHGPDGCIWITDYYREIIEDYSAIPRHLQQQYGVYAGHNRGRIYRLTHRDAPVVPPPDLSLLDADSLARECGSALLWRRQTAQRLLVERNEKRAVAAQRALLTGASAEPSAIITTLHTLQQLGQLRPADVQPFLRHQDAAVRVQALQLADAWFGQEDGRALLEAVVAAAGAETNPRVQIQLALSLGEARDERALALLARLARVHLDVRWMDTALLSSLHGRGVEMLSLLLRDPGGAVPFLGPLAQSIGGHRDAGELVRTLELITKGGPETQATLLNALAKGRKNAPRRPLEDPSARAALAGLAASAVGTVRTAARALEDTFVATLQDDELLAPQGKLPPAELVSEETFRKFVAGLAGPRNRSHGHEIFLQACSPCHRIGKEGSEVGPDLIGQLGMAEESLLKDILLPNERIRPGFETTLVQTHDGGAIVGLLKSDDATSLTLIQAGGVEQVLLRKDVLGVRRLGSSLMPSFAEGLKASDVADLLEWLRSNLGTGATNAMPAAKSDVIQRIQRGERYLTNLFEGRLELLPEYQGSSVYWLFHDNYLAAHVLEEGHPELSRRIRSALGRFGVTNSGKIEIVFGEAQQALPFRTYVLTNVALVDGKTIRTELVTTNVLKGWREYADLLLLAAVAQAGPASAQARQDFDAAALMWDGEGFKDRAATHGGIYATYKLALYLIAADRLQIVAPHRDEVVARLLAMQSTDGGWKTDYRAGKPVGLANVESTCLAVLALRTLRNQVAAGGDLGK